MRLGTGPRPPHSAPRSPSPAERARLREAAGVTQARLAAALKSTPQTVRNRENGRSEPKSPDQPGGWAGRGLPRPTGGVPAGGMRGGAARALTSQRIPRLQPNDPRRQTPTRPGGHASRP
ncbi:helix-turn-helix domain-containing protein [Streptomyces virginiae]|uniref:helix-turn-helix domain-containing protein n=1 Tax=Streptomyces virginiae TaxID=1961 RepID=UPI003AF39554